MERKAVTLAARGPHRKELTHILSGVSRSAIETLSFSQDTETIDFELGLPVCIMTATLTDKIHTKLIGNRTTKIKHSRFHKFPSKMLHCF